MSNETKKPKFKVGDEVEIVAKHYSGKNLKIGQRAKIKEVVIYNFNSYNFAYKLDINGSYFWDINGSYFWFEDELKLVPQQNKDISEGFIKYKINGDKTKVFLHSKNGDFVGESRRNSIDVKDDKIGVLIATSRALGFSKNTVDDIVNVIFKDKKEEISFKVGDRVIGVNNVIDGHILNIKGTVVGIDLKNIAINFDNNVYGHDFGGRFDTPYFKVKSGHGLWVDKSNIKLLDEEEKYNKVEETKKEPIIGFNYGDKVYKTGGVVFYHGKLGFIKSVGKENFIIQYNNSTRFIVIPKAGAGRIAVLDDNLEPIVRQLLKKNDELQEQIDKLNEKIFIDKGII